MGDFRRQRAGHQLVMRGLILHLLLVFTLFKHQTGAGVGLCSMMLISLKVSQYFTRPSKASKQVRA